VTGAGVSPARCRGNSPCHTHAGCARARPYACRDRAVNRLPESAGLGAPAPWLL
jgi:hypothetical protein